MDIFRETYSVRERIGELITVIVIYAVIELLKCEHMIIIKFKDVSYMRNEGHIIIKHDTYVGCNRGRHGGK